MRNIFEVQDGLITGRNGHYEIPKVELLTINRLTFIHGIGKSGKVLNAGLSMDSMDFEQGFVKQISTDVLIRELRARNYALAVWSVDDVIFRGEERDIEVSEEQAQDIIGLIDTMNECN